MYGNNGVHTFLLSGEEVTSEVTPLKEISTQVRKQNGEEFPPNSLLHLVAGIQRYIRIEGRPSIDFLKDSQFSEFRMSLAVVTYLISCRYSSLYFNISILKIKIFHCFIPKILIFKNGVEKVRRKLKSIKLWNILKRT